MKIVTFNHNLISYESGKIVSNKNGLNKIKVLGVTYPMVTKLSEPNTFIYK